MPGVLVQDTPFDPALTLSVLPQSPPLQLPLPLWDYIPVLTRSTMPDLCNNALPPLELPPLRQPVGLNVTLPELYAEDGSLLEPDILLQRSPARVGQWGCNSASPTTMSALSALWEFLPSNFEEDEDQNSQQMDRYSCDEFRMYEFKVRRCTRGRNHDWTECPFVHPGEKARRRDPRRFHYFGTACADFRRGSCKKGDACEYAHGVFESWLHPSRYRTQPCKDGRACQRRICFFAHTPDQLRPAPPLPSPSALSSPISLHLYPKEASESRGFPSPICSPAKKSAPESSKSPLTSSPLYPMTMESLSGGRFAANFCLPSPATSCSTNSSSPLTSPSSARAHIDWSLRGVSNFVSPASAMPKLQPSLHFSQAEASVPPVSAHSGGGLKSALLFPTSENPNAVTSTMQQVEDLMDIWKEVYLTQEEIDRKAADQQPASFFSGDLMHWQGRSGWQAPIRTGGRRWSEEELLIGPFGSDEREPKLERVESGKGLRAQIFERLLSCPTHQDSNSAPLGPS